MWTLDAAIAQAGGRLRGQDVAFQGVVTDSRADCTGQLFVALRGPRFDGHDYVAQAAQAGAVAAMVDHSLPLDLPQWLVDDTRLGLGHLSAAWRRRFPGRVIAITGSNGKTTVKEMLAAILAEAGRVRATAGNLNNHIGMPLTLLAARDEDFLVLEMGANHPGEIAYMTEIARPEIGIITSIGRAHLEGFGSLEGVARAKGEIARGLPRDGALVVPADSPYVELWRNLAQGRRLITFGLDGVGELTAVRDSIQVGWGEADGFRTRFVARIEGQELPLVLDLAGRHNVHNALAAAAAALALGIEETAIQNGLAKLKPVKGRLKPLRCGNLTPAQAGIGLIDDTYNANPDSLAAAIEVLSGLSGRRWLILGDLGELGPTAGELHAEVGVAARRAGLDRLLTVGSLSAAASQAFGPGAEHYAEQEALIARLHAELRPGDWVLVKGSRAARMEQIVEALCGSRQLA